MADLIDKQAVLNGKVACTTIGTQVYLKLEDVAEFINSFSAIDAVEVIRCKDCRFCKKHPTSDDVKMCTNQEWNDECYPLVEDDDYCSRGERREDDG